MSVVFRRMRFFRGLLGLGVVSLSLAVSGRVVTWPAAPGTVERDVYEVSVNGQHLDVMAIPKATALSEDKAFPYSYAMFDADEEVLVEIRAPWDLKNVRLSPRRNAARDVRVAGTNLSFRIKPPFTLAVEPLQTRHRALVLTANRPEENVPSPDDPNVIFVKPGRYHSANRLTIASGKTLYLAPGAWVEGAICTKGTNVTICGRGVISGMPWAWRTGPAHDMVNLSGKNITIRDVTLTSSWFYTLALEKVEGALVDNVKVIGGRCINDDGIDPIRAKDVVIRNCFVRTQDDCIAPKDWIDGLTVENCSLWADRGNPIRLGFECSGGPTKPFRRIRFRHIEILHQSMTNDRPPDSYWSEAAIVFQASNGMTFEDIEFEDVNFCFFPQAMDMFLHIRTLPCQNGAPGPHKEGGHVRNVTFRNITIPPRRPLGSFGIWMQSVDANHAIRDISFEDMKNFEVPVGLRGKVENIKGLPPFIIRDERGTYRDYESWQPYRTRVACIGDSITFGTGLRDPAHESYPARLQELLDAKFPGKYEVRNFGNPGRGIYTNRLFKGTNRAYSRQPEHARALAWHPDIVISNLGINDGGVIEQEEFVRLYRGLLDEYRALTTKPKIVIWSNLAPLGRAHGFCGDPKLKVLNGELARLAKEDGLDSIDMFTPLADNIESLVVKDGIHPNPEGARRIAEAPFNAVFAQ